MNNSFTMQDLKLVAERIRRILKSGGIGSEAFIRDVTTLVDALENVEEIIFKEEGDE
jgi:hypothetical protein